MQLTDEGTGDALWTEEGTSCLRPASKSGESFEGSRDTKTHRDKRSDVGLPSPSQDFRIIEAGAVLAQQLESDDFRFRMLVELNQSYLHQISANDHTQSMQNKFSSGPRISSACLKSFRWSSTVGCFSCRSSDRSLYNLSCFWSASPQLCNFTKYKVNGLRSCTE